VSALEVEGNADSFVNAKDAKIMKMISPSSPPSQQSWLSFNDLFEILPCLRAMPMNLKLTNIYK